MIAVRDARMISFSPKPHQFRQGAAQFALPPSSPARTSVVEGRAVNICSHRVFRVLTRMYGPAARCKRFSSSCRFAVLHQCIRPLIGAFAPGHHGYQRACVLIKRQASTGPCGSPVCARARKTEPPSRLILSQTSAGNFDRLRHRLLLISRSSCVRAQGCSFVPARSASIAPRAGAVKAGRRAWLAAGSGVARRCLDRAEHGARIKRFGRLHRRSSSARRRVL